MSRLTEDQVRAGLLHDYADVRDAALRYFAESHSPNTEVMPTAIEAVERFGRDALFPRFFHVADLAQTEPTVRWVVGELSQAPEETESEDTYRDCLERLLRKADPRLVRPFEKEIFSVPGLDPDSRTQFIRRLALLDWDSDRLWRELESICEEGKNESCVSEFRWDEGCDVVEELDRRGVHVDRMMDLLKLEIDEFESNPLKWMQPFAVRLAGELRHAPAVPLIVGMLHLDEEMLCEEGQRALIKIGGDTVAQAIRDEFPRAEHSFRIYGAGVLNHLHTDLAVQALIDLWPEEDDPSAREWLEFGLIQQFSTEANEAARMALLKKPRSRLPSSQFDLPLHDLKEDLVTACTLVGQEFPELERWRNELREERRRAEKRAARRRERFMFGDIASRVPAAETKGLLPTPTREEPTRVGRNDPCPCGSGKKWKKCCMAKQSAH